jgi:hypothetical protein
MEHALMLPCFVFLCVTSSLGDASGIEVSSLEMVRMVVDAITNVGAAAVKDIARHPCQELGPLFDRSRSILLLAGFLSSMSVEFGLFTPFAIPFHSFHRFGSFLFRHSFH